MTHSHAHDEDRLSVKLCITVYTALMLFLVATYGLDHVQLGSWNLIVQMIIAVVKSVLVIWFFMEARLTSRLVLLGFGAGLLMIFICFILTIADYASRT